MMDADREREIRERDENTTRLWERMFAPGTEMPFAESDRHALLAEVDRLTAELALARDVIEQAVKLARVGVGSASRDVERLASKWLDDHKEKGHATG